MAKGLFSLPSGCGSKLHAFIDESETYGPHIMERYLQHVGPINKVADIGAGTGRDLEIVRRLFPNSTRYAIECMDDNIALLDSLGVQTHSVDIEREPLPYQDASLDMVICNQVLEHTKELFWILHEMTRSLKVGGWLIIGVPNVASLHNRIGLLLGVHPTQAKTCSAHIRCFSKRDFLLFMEKGFPGGYSLDRFEGSQFYPFPWRIARPLARLMPSMAYSIFFLLRKKKEYGRSFLDYPDQARLQTNFKTG